MTLKNKIYYISIGLILAILIYIGGTQDLLYFIFSILIYSSIFYIFYYIFQKLKKSKNILKFNIFLLEFIKKISLSFIIIIIFIGFFSYYQNNIRPAKMPQFTITNGNKTIIFQAMSHIATPNFYNKIKNEIKKYKKEGYVYFYEGVKPGNKENNKNFNKAIGINFNKDLYKNFSKLYGLTNQNNSLFLGLINNKDYNVDLTIDQIMKIYNKKIKNKSKDKLNKHLPKKVININSEVTKSLAGLNSKELKIIRFLNKGLVNLIIKNQNIQNAIMNNFSNKTLFDVILEERNKNLVKNILQTKYKKIIITYGLMHFNGVLKSLKQKDPRWKIVKIKYFYPIK